MAKPGNNFWDRGPKRFLRLQYLRMLRLKGSPHEIAMGIAVGIFIGFMPIIPFQTAAALVLALIFRASKLAAAAATWISNPFNLPLFYSMLYFVGKKIFPFAAAPFPHGEDFSMLVLAEAGWNLLAVMFLGGLVLGIPSSIACYYLSRKFVSEYKKRKEIRIRKKARERK